MNKKRLIELLEGRWIRTADENWHLVQDGKFVAANGETCYLKSCRKYHIRIFFDSSANGPPKDAVAHNG